MVRLVSIGDFGDFGRFVVADDRRQDRCSWKGSIQGCRCISRGRLPSPLTQRRAKTWLPLASSSMASRRLCAMTGIMTFSSKLPKLPLKVMAASLPRTWAQTCSSISHITGLTLPGMMEEPGWVAGRRNSPKPRRGPEPSKRMSLAILMRLTATVLSAPRRFDHGVLAALRFEMVGRFAQRKPGFRGEPRDGAAGKFGWVLMPVPTAVPPRASSPRFFSRGAQPRDAVLDLAGVTAEFLAQPDGRGVLQMGAANFKHVVKFLRLGRQSLLQFRQGRESASVRCLPARPGAWRWE